MILFISLLITGAITNWLSAFAIGFDMFIQAIVWDAPIGVTVSSRAGLAARNGRVIGAKLVNFIMGSSSHCEDAIGHDIARAKEALKALGAL